MTIPDLRAATPDDVDAVADYHQRCFEETYSSQLVAGSFGAPDLDGTRRQLLEWFTPGSRFETWVVDDGSVAIAHFTVLDHHLVHLFVDPGHQGRGLGRQLLARAEALIAGRGHSELELKARVENVGAIAFYEKAGWVVTDRLVHTVEHGISYDERVLVKNVAWPRSVHGAQRHPGGGDGADADDEHT